MGDTMSEIIVQIPPHCNLLESASARVAGNMFFGFLTIYGSRRDDGEGGGAGGEDGEEILEGRNVFGSQ